MTIHSKHEVQIALLKAEKSSVSVPAEYLDFANISFKKLTTVLPEHSEINIYAIDLKKDKQPPYGLVYSLSPVELETLKIYIKINLANGFICSSIFPVGALILFDQKSDGSFRLYVDYQGFNNLIIKNKYPILLIVESLD